ncbi:MULTISPECIES: spore protease YyaC [Brevibacillus]|jgi:putative sporulation protein YyaC|uniref:Putative sporulation protein YyaC n=1 Tax=Brevibacillus centrosporus TaxID=54910 RepID=A0A1I3M553_9BACL|nr:MULTISPECIES: spore protease YyaC [Brevibacillus]MEC2131267.1 spore protease YyaC [Brevibacillus centrosporus]MED4906795.1 spore protease YyaC [Brevibacillus centrosporus]RNB72696.1 spore protease YyaC [Brevibacillus centrosporus]SFI92092.1 putative sporulation protein YyaC [Brevibacillus centrosporus]
MLHYCHYLDKKSVASLSDALIQHYVNNPGYTEIVIVCIGTNRYSGDSLGPMVGSQLLQQLKGQRHVHIYGTLDNPVHALNMQKTLSHISQKHMRAYVIAVDACLGQFYKIGTLQVVEEPLQPGVSLDKQLPPIGHIHLKGIINNYGPLNHKVLEHTSLTFVQEMSGVVTRILTRAVQEILPKLASEPPLDDSPAATREREPRLWQSIIPRRQG